jgi:hypothetical protein
MEAHEGALADLKNALVARAAKASGGAVGIAVENCGLSDDFLHGPSGPAQFA